MKHELGIKIGSFLREKLSGVSDKATLSLLAGEVNAWRKAHEGKLPGIGLPFEYFVTLVEVMEALWNARQRVYADSGAMVRILSFAPINWYGYSWAFRDPELPDREKRWIAINFRATLDYFESLWRTEVYNEEKALATQN